MLTLWLFVLVFTIGDPPATNIWPWIYLDAAQCETNRAKAAAAPMRHLPDTAHVLGLSACVEIPALPVGGERSSARPEIRPVSQSLSEIYLDSEADALDTMLRERTLLAEILDDPRASVTAKAIAKVRLRDLSEEITRSRERMRAILDRKERLDRGERLRPE
jgi:hypothetical protein